MFWPFVGTLFFTPADKYTGEPNLYGYRVSYKQGFLLCVYCNASVEFIQTKEENVEISSWYSSYSSSFLFYICAANTIHYNLQCKCINWIRPFVACQIIITLSHRIYCPFRYDQMLSEGEKWNHVISNTSKGNIANHLA